MRVLVIRCGALGDLVYATSVIDALKLEYGKDCIIDFVCTPSSGKLFDYDDRVNQVFLLKHKKIPIWLSSQKKEIVKASKDNPYDLVINFEYGKQFKSLIEAVEAKKKVGAIVEDIEIPPDVKHMVEKTKYLFKSVVSDEVYQKSFPRIVGVKKQEIKEKFSLDKEYIVISPSNSHQKRSILNYRAWENSSWIELIRLLSHDRVVVIVGNSGEDEFFDKLKPYPNGVIDLVGKSSLVELIGIIDGAKAVVSTDTGTAHMASALETEVFTLIGPTPADETGPYKTPTNKVHIISSNKDCSPCYKTEVMKNCKDNICMKDISVEQVYAKIVKLWS